MRDYAWGPGGLDTIITQLLNQLENTGPPPASDDQLRNLPVVTIGQEELGMWLDLLLICYFYVRVMCIDRVSKTDKNVQCAICMDDFRLDDKSKRLPCKHYFHEPCIIEWLRLVCLFF